MGNLGDSGEVGGSRQRQLHVAVVAARGVAGTADAKLQASAERGDSKAASVTGTPRTQRTPRTPKGFKRECYFTLELEGQTLRTRTERLAYSGMTVWDQSFIMHGNRFSQAELVLRMYGRGVTGRGDGKNEYDRREGADFLGQLRVPLAAADEGEAAKAHWCRLEPLPPVVPTARGKLEFRAWFDMRRGHSGDLHVHVLRARGVEAADWSGTSDAYVVVTVVQAGEQVSHRTHTVWGTLDPEWQDAYIFRSVRRHRDHVLKFELYDRDRFGSDDPLGELRLPLTEVQPCGEGDYEAGPRWLPFQAHATKRVITGDVNFQAFYLDAARTRLVVRLQRARGIRAADAGGTSDPYVTVQVRGPGGFATKSQHTSTIFETLAPSWAETFRLTLENGAMGAAPPGSYLHLEMYDYDKHDFDDFLGAVRYPLRELPAADVGESTSFWLPLRPRGAQDEAQGMMLVRAFFFGKPLRDEAIEEERRQRLLAEARAARAEEQRKERLERNKADPVWLMSQEFDDLKPELQAFLRVLAAVLPLDEMKRDPELANDIANSLMVGELGAILAAMESDDTFMTHLRDKEERRLAEQAAEAESSIGSSRSSKSGGASSRRDKLDSGKKKSVVSRLWGKLRFSVRGAAAFKKAGATAEQRRMEEEEEKKKKEEEKEIERKRLELEQRGRKLWAKLRAEVMGSNAFMAAGRHRILFEDKEATVADITANLQYRARVRSRKRWAKLRSALKTSSVFARMSRDRAPLGTITEGVPVGGAKGADGGGGADSHGDGANKENAGAEGGSDGEPSAAASAEPAAGAEARTRQVGALPLSEEEPKRVLKANARAMRSLSKRLGTGVDLGGLRRSPSNAQFSVGSSDAGDDLSLSSLALSAAPSVTQTPRTSGGAPSPLPALTAAASALLASSARLTASTELMSASTEAPSLRRSLTAPRRAWGVDSADGRPSADFQGSASSRFSRLLRRVRSSISRGIGDGGDGDGGRPRALSTPTFAVPALHLSDLRAATPASTGARSGGGSSVVSTGRGSFLKRTFSRIFGSGELSRGPSEASDDETGSVGSGSQRVAPLSQDDKDALLDKWKSVAQDAVMKILVMRALSRGGNAATVTAAGVEASERWRLEAGDVLSESRSLRPGVTEESSPGHLRALRAAQKGAPAKCVAEKIERLKRSRSRYLGEVAKKTLTGPQGTLEQRKLAELKVRAHRSLTVARSGDSQQAGAGVAVAAAAAGGSPLADSSPVAGEPFADVGDTLAKLHRSDMLGKDDAEAAARAADPAKLLALRHEEEKRRNLAMQRAGRRRSLYTLPKVEDQYRVRDFEWEF